MVKEAIEILKNSGYRITPVRKAIFKIFTTNKKPISVERITEKLIKKGLHPNKTTIYREIHFLETRGFIKEIQFKSDRHRLYEMTSLGHHHHIVCTGCEKVEDLPMTNDMEEYEKKILQKTSFKIFEHSIEFSGLCRMCQRA